VIPTRNAVIAYGSLLALLSAVVWWGIAEHDSHVRELAIWYQRDSVRTVEIRRLQSHADSLDRAYKVDTVHLTKTQTKYEQLAGRVDSMFLHDTVKVPVEVVRELKRDADSTIQACTVVRLTCEARVAVLTAQRDSMAASAKANLGLSRPSISQRVYAIGRDYVLLRALEAAVVAATRK